MAHKVIVGSLRKAELLAHRLRTKAVTNRAARFGQLRVAALECLLRFGLFRQDTVAQHGAATLHIILVLFVRAKTLAVARLAGVAVFADWRAVEIAAIMKGENIRKNRGGITGSRPKFTRPGERIGGAVHGGEDRAANDSRDFGDYGVSEHFKSVCPVGYPISHSTHIGFSAPDVSETTCDSINCLPIDERRLTAGEDRFPLSLSSEADGVGQYLTAAGSPLRGSFAMLPRFSASFARGVGQNPDPVASVRRTNGGSWYAVPLRIIPERGQVSENSSKPSTKQSCDVLHDDKSGCQFANKTGDFGPKARTFSGKSCALSGSANVLAWEPARDNVNGANPIGSKSLCGKLAHVSVAGDFGPMLCEDAAGKVFDFAERDCFKAGVFAIMGCPFQPQRKAAYSREKIEDTQLAHSPRARLMALPISMASGMATAKYSATAARMMMASRIYAASAWEGDRQGSIASSVSIWSSDSSASTECRQPVLRRMWMASGRGILSRLPLRISLA